MKLVLLRHGESEWNLENRFTGWTDVDLSDNGRKEALSAGKALLDGGYDFDICYTSYLKRAIHTLDAVLRRGAGSRLAPFVRCASARARALR